MNRIDVTEFLDATTRRIVITKPGNYVVPENLYCDLDVRCSDVDIEGNDFTIFGWIHAGDAQELNRVSIRNLNVNPPRGVVNLEEKGCTICGATQYKPMSPDEAEAVNLSVAYVCVHGGVSLIRIKILAPVSQFAVLYGKDSHKSQIEGLDLEPYDNCETIYIKSPTGPVSDQSFRDDSRPC